MRNLFTLLTVLLLFGCNQQKPYETLTIQQKPYETLTITENGYTYETVVGDPMKTRIYTLDNGLKVYLSDYKNEPRVQVYIAVKAGSKNDPAENTGLAHYLEHMMFKGTEDFGTMDFEAEKPYLDSIEHMFQYYSTLTDPAERKAYYQLIDQVSNEAAKYAIPNEYDKMVATIGATGTNAYTAPDRTVYVNDVPSNELDRYLELEGNRFKTITNRLFHTELEAVYEEKNRSLDNDGRKMSEGTLAALFKNHTYGTQTSIGTIEHLKNPSITAIKRFFNKYYAPNNVAICISGDLDYDKTMATISEYFGDWKPNESLTPWEVPKEDPITETQALEVFGPSSESVWISYRFDGFGSEEFRYMSLISMILNNASAGLIDLNLVQQQKVLDAGCDPWDYKDYSIHNFDGTPKQNQSLEEVRDLLLGQIDLLKKGEFEDWLIPAVIADFKKGQMKGLENNSFRADNMVMAFTTDISWSEYIQELDKMEKITKQQVMDFAQKHYKDNYVVAYKRIGEDPNKQSVEKPQITKLQVNRDVVSDFQNNLLSKEVEKLKPVYVDYEKDINKTEIKGIEVLSKVNEENELFSLIYLLDLGNNESPKLAQAVQYMEFIGTDALSSEDFKKELYKLGCDFTVNSSNERTYVVLTGLDEKMEASTTLFEQLFLNPKADQAALDKLVDRKLQARTNAKKNKRQILWGGLVNYARYGASNPFTNKLTNAELTNLDASELIEEIKKIPSLPHRILYYGPRTETELVTFLNEYHNIPDNFIDPPQKVVFEELNTDIPKAYWVDYDMAQSEIVLLSVGDKYDASLEPKVEMFNEYFAGSMSSIVFQEIREAQGLAYSVFSSYSQPRDPNKSDFFFAYLGTQADKQPEAMEAMVNLINEFPESEAAFSLAKDAILNRIESERVTRSGAIWSYINAQQAGLDYDIRKDIYEQVKTMTFEDLKAFQEDYIKGKKFTTVMIGSKDKIDFADLKKYGEIKELSLEEIFGYEESENVNLQ